MSAHKFTQRDRMLVAGMVMQGLAAFGDGRNEGAQAKMAVERADALLLVLVDTPPPACVDMEAPSLPEQLGATLDQWLSQLVHNLTYVVPR